MITADGTHAPDPQGAPSRGVGEHRSEVLRARRAGEALQTVVEHRAGVSRALGARPVPHAVGEHRREVLRARAPRPLANALDALARELEPVSLLGRVQSVWTRATGPAIAAAAAPVAEHEGVLTVLCESSVWANELDMLSSELVHSLNAQLGSKEIVKLRCRTR